MPGKSKVKQWNTMNSTQRTLGATLFLNSLLIGNTTNQNYTATGLLPNTTYTVSVFTWDNASNRNNTGISNTSTTLANQGINPTATTLPGPVANLTVLTQTNTSLTWNWTNPMHQNFSSILIYLNNILQGNTTSTTYTASNLQPGTTYTLTLLTTNSSGSTTGQGVSNTTATLSNIRTLTPGTNTGDTGGKKKRALSASPSPSGAVRIRDETTPEQSVIINISEKRTQPFETSGFILLILAALSILLLLFLLLFFLGKKRKTFVSHSATYKMPGF